MIIKPAQYKKIRKTVTVQAVEEQYGCDCCKKKIIPWDQERLQLRVFRNPGGECTDHHFCSWKCVFKFVPTIDCNYFFDLPYVSFDNKTKGMTAKDFFEVIKKFK
jgi:hypothetical protein